MNQAREYAFAYQPILGPNHSIVAMELLYRQPGEHLAEVFDDTTATTEVITNLFLHGRMDSLLGHRKAFINVGKDLLLSDMLFMLPRDKVTIELLENISVSRETVERCHRLKAMGYSLALDDLIDERIDEFAPFLEVVDIVKIDMRLNKHSNLEHMLKKLEQWPLQLLAEKVETIEEYELCKKLGFSMFQGYFFSRPLIINGKRRDPDKFTVLNLLGKLSCDVDIHILESAFKHSSSLTIQLLRLVNSPAFSVGIKINSLGQAITLFGRSQLMQWLQILLFTLDDTKGCPSPLCEAAIRRGRLMELMASSSSSFVSVQFAAHMVGMLSLVDSLLGVSMQEILAELGLTAEIENALLKRQGHLGLMLALCETLEKAEFPKVEEVAQKLGITMHDLMQWQDEAIIWTNDIISAKNSGY